MKKILVHISFLIFLSCSSIKKDYNNTIAFTILNKVISDKDTIKLEIKNRSNKNYYLPILNCDVSDRQEFLSPSKIRSLYWIYKGVKTIDNNEKLWHTTNCYYDSDMDAADIQFNKYLKNISLKDIVLLYSKKRIVLKIPFNLIIKNSKKCSWTIKDIKESEKYKLYLRYFKNSQADVDENINSKLLDTLKQKGFEFYDKEILSNEVTLIIEKK